MDYDKAYPTKKAKNDKIKEFEKEVVQWIAYRDTWLKRYKQAVSECSEYALKVDAMQTAIDGQKELVDSLLKKNAELVEQIRELESRTVGTVEASPINEVQLSLDGHYTVVFDRNTCKVVGVAK